MDTKQLGIFLSVARYLNFTKAAQEHYMTQPAVSHLISELERELDAKLFLRNSHHVELTTAGTAFREHAREIIAKSEIAKSDIYNISHGKVGRIKLLTVQNCVDLTVKILSEFSKRYPNIHTEVELVTGAAQIAAINNGEADVYVSFSSLLQSYADIEFINIREGRYALLLPKDYDKQIDISNLSSLSDLPIVCELRNEAPFLTEQVFRICSARGLSPQNVHWCKSAFSMLVTVRSGLGFSIFPSAAQEDSVIDDMRVVPLEGDDCIIGDAIGWNKHTKNLAMKYFIEVVRDLTSSL